MVDARPLPSTLHRHRIPRPTGHTHHTDVRQRYLSGNGPVAASPGYSNHQHGQALDIDMVDPAAKAWMFEHGPTMGWRNTVPSESWHWEYFGP